MLVIILGLFLLLQVVLGYRKGFIKAMMQLAAWILSFALASAGAKYVQGAFKPNTGNGISDVVSHHASYLLAFVILVIVLRIIFAVVIHYVNKIGNIPGLGIVNRLAGAVLGLVKGGLVIAVVILVVSYLPKVGMDDRYHQITGGNQTLENAIENNLLQQIDLIPNQQ